MKTKKTLLVEKMQWPLLVFSSLLIVMILIVGTWYYQLDTCGFNGWDGFVCFSKSILPELYAGVAAGIVVVVATPGKNKKA